MKLRFTPGAALARALTVGCGLLLVNGAAAAATLTGAGAAGASAVAGAGAIAAVPVAAAAATATSTPLDAYLENLKTLRADFLQTLVDAHGREVDRATGTLVVSRPGKFRWEIHPQSAAGQSGATGNTGVKGAGHNTDNNGGGASGAAGSGASGSGSVGGTSGAAAASGQLMVADGRNLWFLDRDLEQVTVKPVDAVLSATPAMLLSGTVDVRKHFTIKPAGQREGLEWVLVEPNGADADFRSVLFGFDHGELKRMILDDKLGQTATINFQRVVRNGPVAPEEVSFTPPPGVDVIGTPQK